MAFKLFEAKVREKEKESQMEAALEALRKSEALYLALIETSPDAIALSDQNGIIIMANPQLAKLHGYESKEELIGKSAFELFAPEERQRASDNLGGAIGAGAEGIGKFE
jgi:PAS domain S-box-containing protein